MHVPGELTEMLADPALFSQVVTGVPLRADEFQRRMKGFDSLPPAMTSLERKLSTARSKPSQAISENTVMPTRQVISERAMRSTVMLSTVVVLYGSMPAFCSIRLRSSSLALTRDVVMFCVTNM